MMKTFSINVLSGTFVKSPNNAITGKICIEADNYVFPEREWDDFVVIILGWWLREIVSLSLKQSITGSCKFMDGPFQFNIKVMSTDIWLVQFIRRTRMSDEHLLEDTVSSQTVLNAALSATESVLKLCQEKGWSSPEISTLLEAYVGLRKHSLEKL